MVKLNDPVIAFEFETVYGDSINTAHLNSPFTLLAFHRYASCPICNLSLKNFERRHEELAAAGLQYLPVFHSPREKMREYYPVAPPFPLLIDPEMKAYRLFGVESSILKTISISSGIDFAKSVFGGARQSFSPDNDMATIPADFLIHRQKIVQLKYGKSIGDSWTVDEALAFCKP